MDSTANQATPDAIVQAAKDAGCRSIAFTYNDPVIWAEYAIDTAKIARAEGIKTVAVTAGYISPTARKEFYQWIDAANIDLKAFNESFYRRLTQTHLQPVLDTLEYLKHETDVWFEITNLIIPNENDDPDEIKQMCDWIVDHLGDQVPIHFSAFHPDFKMMNHPRTPHEMLLRAQEQALTAGIKYAYVGNVNDVDHQSTYCPNCKQILIERNWYQLGTYNLDNHRCNACGHNIPGIFDTNPGTWGPKRLPLRILEQQPTQTPRIASMSTTSQTPAKPESTTEISTKPAKSPKIDFTEDQISAILTYTRDIAQAAITGETTTETLPDDLINAPAYGMFVTFQRQQTLRACRGRWGGASQADAESPFGPMLEQVTTDSATLDPRFPAITPEEIPLLSIDVSVMHSPAFLDAQGQDRANQVKVGTHGLVLLHPRSQGLLLPQVATEAKWTSKTFLDQVCRKAGLPNETWHSDPNARIMTFEANVLTTPAIGSEFNASDLTPELRHHLTNCINRLLNDEPIDAADYANLVATNTYELGMHLRTENGVTAATLGPNHSLLELARLTTKSLKDHCTKSGTAPGKVSKVILMHQPIRLRAEDYPDRHRYLAAHATVARYQGRWAIIFPDPQTRHDTIAKALSNLGINPRQWSSDQAIAKAVRATAFSVFGFAANSTAPRTARKLQTPLTKPLSRPMAHAGSFYPDDPAKMNEAIDQHLTNASGQSARTDRQFRGVMLPHAGWVYCGNTIGKTLARVNLPQTAIVLGPKHTFDGPSLSVASHTSWQIPGGSVPIATDLVNQLTSGIDQLQCESAAHKTEHGIEVLLPFLYHLRPDIRVCPIVIGGVGFDAAIELGRQLASVISKLTPQPLIVISSDMNHFADEAENRRRDQLALQAMQTTDPKALFDTCQQNEISMCGLLPAVTAMHALSQLKPLRQIEIVDYTNSAAVTGDTARVVGYAGALLT